MTSIPSKNKKTSRISIRKNKILKPLFIFDIHTISDALSVLNCIKNIKKVPNVKHECFVNINLPKKSDVTKLKKIYDFGSLTNTTVYYNHVTNNVSLQNIKTDIFSKHDCFIMMFNVVFFDHDILKFCLSQTDRDELQNKFLYIRPKYCISDNTIKNTTDNDSVIYVLGKKSIDIIRNQINTELDLPEINGDKGCFAILSQHNIENKQIQIDKFIPSIQNEVPDISGDQLTYIDNEYCAIYQFVHHFWSSYIYLNKRNNRLYHIDNDDHGEFNKINQKQVVVKWDDWGEETFELINSGEVPYYKVLP